MEMRWAAPAVIAAALFAVSGPIGRWAAMAILVAAAPAMLRSAAARPSVAWTMKRWGPRLPTLVLLALLVALFYKLALGHAPASRDHGIHLFQTQILVNERVPTGRLRGWTDSLNAGYPFGDSYPLLGYVVTGFASIVSLGAVPLRVSYAWGLLAIWVFSALAVSALTRTIADEVLGESDRTTVRWAGTLAAAAWLMDPGASQGGWNYLMFHGVWPQQLSTALWVAAIPLLWRAVALPSPRRLAWASLALGGSILAHPFGLLTAAASAIAWIPALAWASHERRIEAGSWRWWIVIHGGAALLAAGWLTAFFAGADEMGRSPVPYQSLGSLASSLFAGELFSNTRALSGVAALLGFGLAVRHGAVVAAVVSFAFVGLLIASSHAAITVLGLDLLVSGFKNLQFPRYTIALKPVWFAFAGVGAAWLARAWLSPPAAGERRFGLWRVLVPVVFAPLLVATCSSPSGLAPRPVGSIGALEGTVHARADRELRKLLLLEQEALGDVPMRVAFLRTGMGGATYALFAITDVGAGLVLDSHVPAINYRHWLKGRDLATLQALGTTHLLHDKPLRTEDEQLRNASRAVGRAGVWTLKRLRVPADGHVSSPSAYSAGGTAQPVGGVQTNNGWRFDITPSAEPRRLGVTLGPYRKWEARSVDDRSTLPLVAAAVSQGLPGLFVEANGPFELRYVESNREEQARWLAWAVFALASAALFFGRQIRPLPRKTLRWPAVIGIAVVGLAVTVFVLWTRGRSIERTWLAADSVSVERGQGVAVRDLVIGDDYALSDRTFPACDGLLGRDAQAGCTGAEDGDRVGFLYREPYLYRCVNFAIGPGTHRNLVFTRIESGTRFIGIVSAESGGLRIELGGLKHRVRRGRPERVRTRPVDGQVSMRVVNNSAKVRRACVAASTIRGGAPDTVEPD